MKHVITLILLILSGALVAQNNITKNAAIAYTAGAPTFTPGKTGTQVAIDTVTWLWYEHNGASWNAAGYRMQTISGCSAPNYTPTKYQSRLVVNACTAGQGGPELYYWTGSVWLQINEGQTYMAGAGIGIASGVITNSAPNTLDSTFSLLNGQYLGKTPNGNVYKNGTLGIGTADTTGVLNVSAKNVEGIYRPMIFSKGVSNLVDSVNLFQLYQPSDTSAAPFIFGVVNSGNISAAGKNSSFYWGQNVYPGGAKIQSGKSAMFQFWETNFTNSLPILGNVPTYEWHMAFVPSNNAGSDQRRILTSAYDQLGRFGNFGIKADELTFYKFGSIFSGKPSVYASMDFYNNTFDFNDTMSIVLRKPNVGGYYATKSDNSVVNLMSIDASNRVSIAPNNATTIFTGANTIESAGGLKITANTTANLTLGDNVKTGAVIVNGAATEVLRIQNPLSTSGFAMSLNGFELAIRDMSVNRDIFQIEENGITDAQYIHANGRICFGGRADFDVQLHLKKTTLGATTKMFRIENSTGGSNFFRTNATPESSITANPGDVALASISSVGELYIKDSGTGNTGWLKAVKNQSTAAVSIGTSSAPAASAQVDIVSTTKIEEE